jgi:hypothetical protein
MREVRVLKDRAGEGEPGHERAPAETSRRSVSGQGGTDEQ